MSKPLDYYGSINYIKKLRRFGINLGLERIIRLLAKIGSPERGLHVAHLAGTNGKGSAIAFLGSILKVAGYRTGIFTSPYLERFTESIKIDSVEISPTAVAEGVTEVAAAVAEMVAGGGDPPTEFEAVTAMAFRYFALHGADPVILETGLGGRYDSTNVVDTPLATAITGIALDHTDRLGNTLQEIAREKAGILKPGVSAVLGPMPEVARAVIEREGVFLGCPLVRAGEDFYWQRLAFFWGGQILDIFTAKREYRGVQLRLLGPHQAGNAAVAVALAELLEEAGYRIGEKAIKEGLAEARWPGRLEVVSRNPLVILDGAHNPDGAKALRLALEELLSGEKVSLVTAVMADKDAQAILAQLAPVVGLIFPVKAANSRSLDPTVLATAAGNLGLAVQFTPNLAAALTAARESVEANKTSAVLVAGSLYLVGEARGILL